MQPGLIHCDLIKTLKLVDYRGSRPMASIAYQREAFRSRLITCNLIGPQRML